MMDPGMQAAPMPAPPMGDPAMGGMPAPISPVEAVVMALKNMQMERGMEDDVLLKAVMAATGQMQGGMAGVTEGGMPPVADPAMGAY